MGVGLRDSAGRGGHLVLASGTVRDVHQGLTFSGLARAWIGSSMDS